MWQLYQFPLCPFSRKVRLLLDAGAPDGVDVIRADKGQLKRVFDNLSAVAQASGGTLNDIVKLNIFLTDLSHFAKVNEIMATYFQAPYPARAAIGVAALPRGSQAACWAASASWSGRSRRARWPHGSARRGTRWRGSLCSTRPASPSSRGGSRKLGARG